MSEPQKEVTIRDRSADVLRALAIVLVVLGHANRGLLEANGLNSWTALRELDFMLYALHMPAFFYLAGYYTQRSVTKHGTSHFAKSRWGTNVYPYLFWSVSYYCLNVVASNFTQINSPITASNLTDIWWQPIHILWFLYSLLLLQCVAMLLRHRPVFFLILCAGSFATLAAFGNGPTPVILGSTVHNSVYFSIGFLLANRGYDVIDARIRRPIIVTVATMFFFVVLPLTFYMGERNPAQIWLVPVSGSGVIILARCAYWLRNVSWLQFVGQKSFEIYILHVVILAFIPRAMSMIGLQSNLVTLSVGTLVGVLGSLAAYSMIQRLRIGGLLGFIPASVPGAKWISAT